MTDRQADGQSMVIGNGFFPFPVSLKKVADVYEAYGYETHIIPYDVENMSDVRIYAQTILEHVRRIQQATGQATDYLGLSMGGVAGLYALKYLGADQYIRNLVAAGSPFHGSPLAPYGLWWAKFSQTARQLAAGSEFLRDLRQAPLPAETRFISLGGLFDVICPYPTTRVKDAENYTWFFCHHDLMITTWMHHDVIKLLV